MNLMDLQIAVHDLENIIISERSHLQHYFPSDIKIYEFCAGDETTPKEVKLNDISYWLCAKQNRSFIFQCLLCRQEMNFCTVFLTGNYVLNRSHLLTKKHKQNVENIQCVGLLFNTSKKFVLCNKVNFENGRVFEDMKLVSRRVDAIINENVLNKVFCRQFKMYTLDRATRKLTEFEYEDDIVLFMRSDVRPLFAFICLFCDINCNSYTRVVQHLLSAKHHGKVGTEQSAIIAVRDFNIFINVSLDKLSTILYNTHLNSYLEEMIVAGEGTVIVTASHYKDEKPKPNNRGVSVHVEPIILPDGKTKTGSIRINTRFQNFLEDQDENALSRVNSNFQKNVTIYEFSGSDLREFYAENLLYSVLSVDCKIWCSRCSTPIYSVDEFQAHLMSQKHVMMTRNNEQVGFMCYVCKVFFVELKGDMLYHIHNGHKNRDIIKAIKKKKLESITYGTQLNRDITSVYSDILENVSEPFKFCCLTCFDLTKRKLMYLPNHEVDMGHTTKTGNVHMFSLCEYCEVIYIYKGIEGNSTVFKEHFANHLDCVNTIQFSIWHRDQQSNISPLKITVDNHTLSSKQKLIPYLETIKINASLLFCQLLNPGISAKEFKNIENWTEIDIEEYISSATSEKVELYTCLCCQNISFNKQGFIKHLFTICGNKEVHFLKYCDVCHDIISSGSLRGLQEHFIGLGHLNKLLMLAGITQIQLTVDKSLIESCKTVFASKYLLLKAINQDVNAMKETWAKRQQLFQAIETDFIKVLSKCLPSIAIEQYGSRHSGLALDHSDLDLNLNIGTDNFNKVESLILGANSLFKVLRSLPDAAVPIIRLLHIRTKTQCDISFDSKLNKYCSGIIKLYIDFDERVFWLLAAVKHWAELTKLKDARNLTSNAINWLVLFYLMQPDVRIIPNVSYVIQFCGGLEKVTEQGTKLKWENKCDFNKKKDNLDLLQGFFHYYSFMKFSEYKLFPFNGLVIPDKSSGCMFLQSPVNDENTLSRATLEFRKQFQILCYFTLNLEWRIN